MPDRQPPASASEVVLRVNEQLEIAVGAARGAKAIADAGDTAQALAMLRNVEPPLFELMTLLNAASLLRGNHQRNA
jgi:hypothetical protein